MDSDTSEYSDIHYRVEENIAEIVLDRPEYYHSLRHETLYELDSARERSTADDDIKAIILRSVGDDAFCTGADLNVVDEIVSETQAVEDWIDLGQRVFMQYSKCELPVIGCVTGQALAGGFELVLVCDLVVAGPNSELGDYHMNFNLLPGGGGSQLLPRIIGSRRAKELLLTGKTISAEQALEWGIVNRIGNPAKAAAKELAKNIASQNPEAVDRTLRLLDVAGKTNLEDGIDFEREVVIRHLQSEAVKEGLAEFLDGNY